jgi:GDSL-like Lipase/Acylhydrolase family
MPASSRDRRDEPSHPWHAPSVRLELTTSRRPPPACRPPTIKEQQMKSRTWLTALAATAIVFGVASAASAEAASSVPGGPEPVDPTPLPISQSAPPRAVVGYRLQPRADGFAAAWSTGTDTYAGSYVRPTSWAVALDACRSLPGVTDSGGPVPIVDYSWTLEPIQGQSTPVVRVHTASCRRTVSIGAVGAWRLTLTVSDGRGQRGTATRSTTFRDLLVVSVGDSYASGEGNPNADGSWTDQQCHRSRNGWPARVARSLEGNSTTVTFLSYACSGAELRHLYAQSYEGAVPGSPLPPQIIAARQALGAPTATSTRRVDLLLASGGVNDLGFSDILEDCALSIFSSCIRSLSDEMSTLAGKYDGLGAAIRANLKVGSTMIAEYPARVFTDDDDHYDGCGAFRFMNHDEARWIGDMGAILDFKIAAAAERNHWTSVPVTDSFRGHGYCADDTWFRSWSGSEAVQGDHDGTAHPLSLGHAKVAALVRAAM